MKKQNKIERARLHPHYVAYCQDVQAGRPLPQTPQGRGRGFIPPPLDLSHLKGRGVLGVTALKAPPSKFDLRQSGRVGPVKDQGPVGTCWAFASCGSLESCLLPGEKRIFSENSMKNLLSSECAQGFDRGPGDGGNQYMATAYLARWSGPVTEEQDPYEPFSRGCQQFNPVKHVEQVIYIPDRKNAKDNQNLKNAVMKYGAVFTSFYYDDRYFNAVHDAYCYQGGEYANHAVCIVGWDDDFDRKNFRQRPSGNGAFILQNSWGRAWGDNGYFYVSYYDSLIGTNNAMFNHAESPDAYDIIHQYDPWGWVSSLGFNHSTAWFACIYQAGPIQTLQAISWYTASPGSHYHLYLYLDPDPDKPRSGTLSKSIDGTAAQPGYHKFVFKKPLQISKGQRFSVVIQLTTPKYNYPIPVQMPLEGYSSKARAEKGHSYISADGKVWIDAVDFQANTSVCLKAFARS